MKTFRTSLPLIAAALLAGTLLLLAGCEKETDCERGKLVIYSTPEQDPFLQNTVVYASFFPDDGGMKNIIKPLPDKLKDITGTIDVEINIKPVAKYQGGIYCGYKIKRIKIL
jgi:ABC-type oligopeptide transport system substrate-binding subunit